MFILTYSLWSASYPQCHGNRTSENFSFPCPHYNFSFQMYPPRAAFLKSMVFSVGIRRFKVRGVVYSYQTISRDAMEQLTWLLSILAISSLGNHLNSLQLPVCD